MADSEKSVAVGYADRVAALVDLALNMRSTARRAELIPSKENRDKDDKTFVAFVTSAAHLRTDLRLLEAELH